MDDAALARLRSAVLAEFRKSGRMEVSSFWEIQAGLGRWLSSLSYRDVFGEGLTSARKQPYPVGT